MSVDEIQEFARQKKKEFRMKMNKRKETASMHHGGRQANKTSKVLLEKTGYEERQCWG